VETGQPLTGLHDGYASDMEEDGELVDRTLAGDLTAFEELVKRHRDVVFRLASRTVGPTEAEDVSQDAFLLAFHRLSGFRGEAPFRSWLLRIAHNAALNQLARRRPQPTESLGPLVEQNPDRSAHTPAQQVEEHERLRRLERKVRMLSPSHRIVLVLRDIEGLTYEEIAQVTETPLGSVKGRLHRARGELIELLRANTYDWGLPR
jgi:RNA polymerase sigma-70 factor (ECF subfamily)